MNSDFQSYGGEFITTENITQKMKDFYLDIHQPFPLLYFSCFLTSCRENHTYQLVLAYVVDSPVYSSSSKRNECSREEY